MQKPMRVSVIVTTYNWPKALDKVLASIEAQHSQPFEVIIADDGSKKETRELIEQWQHNSTLNLTHCWQEDNGFRLAQSRNNALRAASGDYIIMIDGDMVLDKRFIDDHLYHAEPGYFIQGWRVRLNPQGSEKIFERNVKPSLWFGGIMDLKNRCYAIHSRLMQRFAVGTPTSISGTKGCNMAFWRSDAEKVNGFSQDFVGWGSEDNEFACRLKFSGCKRKRLRHGAIAYHLYHDESPKAQLAHNVQILDNTKKHRLTRCKNGLVSEYMQ